MVDILTDLANKYASDKGTEIPNDGRNHGPRLNFTPIYNEYFYKIRNDKLKIFEIGVGSGSSLKMWYDYFPNSKIYAIDLEDQSKHDNDRVKTFICDQSDCNQLENILKNIGDLDIIIDDGSHVVKHQQISLGFLFRFLKKNGQYWIEDLHTSDEIWQGRTLYGYDMSFKEDESTVVVLENFIKNKIFKSTFLTNENYYLTENISSMKIFDLPKTYWGINKLCLINKI